MRAVLQARTSVCPGKFGVSIYCLVMARKSSLFQSSERFLVLEEALRWLKEVLKWLEEVLNLPPNF